VTVTELIERLKKLPQEAEVRMCMDWSGCEEEKEMPKGQWEDALGDIALSNRKNGCPWVILLNESFK